MLKENLPSVREQIGRLLDELSNIFKGVYLIKDLSPKTTDAIVSYGERLSSVIVCGALPGAVRYDARRFVKTKPYFGRHIVDFASTEELIRETFRQMPHTVVVPGFIASDLASGDATNSAEEVRTIRRRFSPRPSMPRCSKSGPTSTVS